MDIKQITFDNGATASFARISETSEIQKAFEFLELSHPKPVIVLVGGAGGIEPQDQASVQQAIKIVAKLAEETGATIIDGGTRAGIMNEIGKQRAENEYSFPLIGVLPDGKLINKDPLLVMEKNHSQFFLVPGSQWGDESIWIAKIATSMAGGEKSMTILVNGGIISKTDVEFGLKEKRLAVIMRGTGRLADEIPLSDNMFEADISKSNEEILIFLRPKLS